jgi:MbtH protein
MATVEEEHGVSRNPDEEDTQEYKVVVNHEEQYSIWPEWKEIPNGWKAVGVTGPKAECLQHIGEIWTDMRPLSLRRRMEGAGEEPGRADDPS